MHQQEAVNRVSLMKGIEKINAHNGANDEVRKDDGLKVDLAKSKKSKASETVKVKRVLCDKDRIATARGEEIMDKTDKGMMPMGKKSGSKAGFKFERDENATSKCIPIVSPDKKSSNNLQRKTSAKDRVVTPRNSTRGEEIIDKKDREDMPMPKKSGPKADIKFGRDENASNKYIPIVSSDVKSSYYLRSRRGTFQKVDLSENEFGQVVGKKVKVFRKSTNTWYTGRIVWYDDNKKCHKVVYDDGDTDELDMKKWIFELEVMSGEAYTLKSSKNKHVAGKGKGVDGDFINAGEMVKESAHKKSDADPSRKSVTKATKNEVLEVLKKDNEANEKLESSASNKTVCKIATEISVKVGDTKAGMRYSASQLDVKPSREMGTKTAKNGVSQVLKNVESSSSNKTVCKIANGVSVKVGHAGAEGRQSEIDLNTPLSEIDFNMPISETAREILFEDGDVVPAEPSFSDWL